MKTFHLLNFGCRASQADGAALKQQLREAGFAEMASAERSDFAVLNTCTVTATADAEVRQVIRRIHRANPFCRIVVTGCYAQRASEEISQLPGVAWVVGNSHKHTVTDLLKRDAEPGEPRAAQFPVPGSEPRARVLVGEISEDFHFAPAFPDDRTRPTLKIQDGCNARCSFCIIPDVRGASRSLAPEKVIDEIRALEGAGFKEIVLSGINLGSYGRDLDKRANFLGLLEKILEESSVARLRISSIEPMDVSPELIRLVAGSSRLARHFHVPLQSGCDRILRQMNRRYWTTQYAERILAISEQLPNCGIGADVMAGFPGETGSDHAASARFIDSLPFTYLHVFPYSARPTTPAAARTDQVQSSVAKGRSREIRAIAAEKHQRFLAAQVGRTLPALTLDESEDGARVALTSNYLKALLPGPEIAQNTLLDIQVGRVLGNRLYAYSEEDHPVQAALDSHLEEPAN